MNNTINELNLIIKDLDEKLSNINSELDKLTGVLNERGYSNE